MKNLFTICIIFLCLQFAQAQVDRDVPRNARDQVFLDDVIVDGSICIGFDCVNGESFGFKTLILKENNVRLKFFDTSNSASFPTNDWCLEANATTNGGTNHFAVVDESNARVPFKILAGAPTSSIFVDDGGDVGFGTSTPVVNLHVKDGNTPTLRLEQDGTSGFTPQTWDMAGNEANFFIRDVTNGSKLPFRIRPNTPTSAIDMFSDRIEINGGSASYDTRIEGDNDANLFFADASTDNVGIGTSSPNSKLMVEANTSTVLAIHKIVQTGTGDAATLFTAGGAVWNYGIDNSDGDKFKVSNDAGQGNVGINTKLTIQADGNIGIGGNSSPTFDFEIGMAPGSGINAGSTAFTATSSRSFKEKIRPFEMDNILDKIALVPVTIYDWKRSVYGGGEKERTNVLGLIAEDFHTVLGRGSDQKINGQEVQMSLWMAAQELHEKDQEFEELIQEREIRISELEDQITELTSRLDEISELLSSNRQDILLNGGERPMIGQNFPNPYGEETVIEYYVPASVESAEIQFVDIAGKLLKRVSIQKGKGRINLKSQDLPQGNYHYSLIVDGEIVDTKQMSLAR